MCHILDIIIILFYWFLFSHFHSRINGYGQYRPVTSTRFQFPGQVQNPAGSELFYLSTLVSMIWWDEFENWISRTVFVVGKWNKRHLNQHFLWHFFFHHFLGLSKTYITLPWNPLLSLTFWRSRLYGCHFLLNLSNDVRQNDVANKYLK